MSAWDFGVTGIHASTRSCPASSLSLLSLLGLPPLAGYVGKLELFKAPIDAGQTWLAVIAVINTVVSLAYYLRVIAPTLLEPPPADATEHQSSRSLGWSLGTVLAAGTAATVGLGLVAEPLIRLAEAATMLAG